MKLLFDLERGELAERLSPSYRATQIFTAVYRHWKSSFAHMTDIPLPTRSALAEQWDIALPQVHRRFESSDGTRRYLIRLAISSRLSRLVVDSTTLARFRIAYARTESARLLAAECLLTAMVMRNEARDRMYFDPWEARREARLREFARRNWS